MKQFKMNRLEEVVNDDIKILCTIFDNINTDAAKYTDIGIDDDILDFSITDHKAFSIAVLFSENSDSITDSTIDMLNDYIDNIVRKSELSDNYRCVRCETIMTPDNNVNNISLIFETSADDKINNADRDILNGIIHNIKVYIEGEIKK